ncbi:MAG: hypothetical protein WCF10_18445, partial [Polyangiales bacterium]
MIRSLTLGLLASLLVACNGAIDGPSGGVGYDGVSPNASGSDSSASSTGSPRALSPSGALAQESIDGPPEELVNVPPEQVLGIPPQDLANIARKALINASRTGCTSPCPIFFDAISNLSWDEIESSTFTWAFSDGSTSDGYIAAHVFELPEGSGAETFEVMLVVTQQGVAVAQDTHSVTVQPSAGRTICVANSDFSGCPSNNSADHISDVGTAWSAIRTGDRILFRRGDTFAGYQFGSSVAGPVQVGAFGNASAARPVLSQTGDTWVLGTEWSVTDVDVSGAAIGAYLFEQRGNHTLVMRSVLRDTKGAFVSDGNGYNFSTYKFVINNVVTAMNGTNYIGGDYIAFVGNRIERLAANHHTIRIAGAHRVLVSGNDLLSDVGHSSLTV